MNSQILPVPILCLSFHTYRLIYNCTQRKNIIYKIIYIYMSTNASFQG